MKKIFFLLITQLSASCGIAGGTGLYFKPCTPTFNYATRANPSTVQPPFENLSVTSNYDWGFRIFGGVDSSCEELGARVAYTAFDNTTTARVRGEFIVLFILDPVHFNDVIARQKFAYHTVDFRAQFLIIRAGWLKTKLLVGGEVLRFRRTRQIVADDLSFNEVMKYQGAGPELGIEVESCSLGGIRVRGQVRVGALLGDRSIHSAFDNVPTIDQKSGTTATSTLHITMGASYTLPLGCLTVGMEIGYEAHHYFSLIREATIEQIDADRVFFTSKENFGLWGPYARFYAKF